MEKAFWIISIVILVSISGIWLIRTMFPLRESPAEQPPKSSSHVIVGEIAAQRIAEKQFKPRIYTKVIYNEIQDVFNVYVLAAMYPHEAAVAQSFVDSDGMIADHVGSWPKFLEEVSCKTAAEALKEKHRLQKKAQKYIDKTIKRNQEVADSLDYIRNN